MSSNIWAKSDKRKSVMIPEHLGEIYSGSDDDIDLQIYNYLQSIIFQSSEANNVATKIKELKELTNSINYNSLARNECHISIKLLTTEI